MDYNNIEAVEVANGHTIPCLKEEMVTFQFSVVGEEHKRFYEPTKPKTMNFNIQPFAKSCVITASHNFLLTPYLPKLHLAAVC